MLKRLFPALLTLALHPVGASAQTMAETLDTIRSHPEFELNLSAGSRSNPLFFRTLRPLHRYYAITEENCRLLIEPRPELLQTFRPREAPPGGWTRFRATHYVIARLRIDLLNRPQDPDPNRVFRVQTAGDRRISAYAQEDGRMEELRIDALGVGGMDDRRLARAMERLFALCAPSPR